MYIYIYMYMYIHIYRGRIRAEPSYPEGSPRPFRPGQSRRGRAPRFAFQAAVA